MRALAGFIAAPADTIGARMANWRQIQGRIRRAKNSPEAAAKLSELFAKTHDAMVAFELGAIEEKAARTDEAVRWYSTALERFRRADWKKKSAEALERLGAPVPAGARAEEAGGAHVSVAVDQSTKGVSQSDSTATFESPELIEAGLPVAAEIEAGHVTAASSDAPDGSSNGGHKRRRRGRRGGRGRRRRGSGQALPPQGPVPAESSPAHEDSAASPGDLTRDRASEESGTSPARSAARSRGSWQSEAPTLPSERVAHGRGAEPAIASRLAQLESMLRRMLGSQLHTLDEADEAPAGPGVFLLSDSDLVTSYYVEACKTLRVGVGQLVRGVRGGRGQSGGSLRSRLAEHLEISESKVSDYLKKHCVVRWIQLDDEAAHLAHFAIGVLRTPLNAE